MKSEYEQWSEEIERFRRAKEREQLQARYPDVMPDVTRGWMIFMVVLSAVCLVWWGVSVSKAAKHVMVITPAVNVVQ